MHTQNLGILKNTMINLMFQEFRLVHYAGDVTYNVRGFLEKNNDLLYRDLRKIMSHTTNSITKVRIQQKRK